MFTNNLPTEPYAFLARLDKLHLANRVQATLYAMREGLTTLDVDPE